MEKYFLIDNGMAITNSLIVAEKFNRQHKQIVDNIMTTIRMAENSAGLFSEASFKDSLNKEHPYYLMNRNGFSLLAMWFTGKEAQQIYLEFITDINEMEKQFKGSFKAPTTYAQTIQLAEDQIKPRKTEPPKNYITKNTQITLFKNSQFGEIRTMTNEVGEHFFCLLDVCKGLSLNAKIVKQRLSRGVVTTYPLETSGGIQNALFINEDGLYDTILDSRKPEAKSFRKWITSEVLPSIRKTGGYIATGEDDTPESILARAYFIAKDILDRQAKKNEEQHKQNFNNDLGFS